MTFTLTSIGTPGSGYDFQRGQSSDVGSLSALDPAARQLIDGPVTVTLATTASDGRMQLNAMWFEASADGEHVHINTVKGRAKDRHMRATPHISVQAINPENPYQWLTVYGAVEEVIDEDDPERGHLATESIDRLAKTYIGADVYPFRAEGELRSLFRIKPTKIVTFGTA